MKLAQEMKKFEEVKEQLLDDFGIKVGMNACFSVCNAEDNEADGQVKMWRNYDTVDELRAYLDALHDVKNHVINHFK